jgi:Helix-turn-helix domain
MDAAHRQLTALTTSQKPLPEGPQMTAVVEHRLYPIPDVVSVLSMSRSVIYEQIRAGRLSTVKQGRRRYVTAAGITEYIALLEREASAHGNAA